MKADLKLKKNLHMNLPVHKSIPTHQSSIQNTYKKRQKKV